MTAPVTRKIHDLFQKHGLDKFQYDALAVDIMNLVYDHTSAEVDNVLGGRPAYSWDGKEEQR